MECGAIAYPHSKINQGDFLHDIYRRVERNV